MVSPTPKASFMRMLRFFELDWDELEGRPSSARFGLLEVLPPAADFPAVYRRRVVWRGGQEGYSAAGIHERLNEIGAIAQLVIVQDQQGNVLGGYTNPSRPRADGKMKGGVKSIMNGQGRLVGEGIVQDLHMQSWVSWERSSNHPDKHFYLSEFVIALDCDKNMNNVCSL
eukprot:751577-Hanusia_phi.AAC.3